MQVAAIDIGCQVSPRVTPVAAAVQDAHPGVSLRQDLIQAANIHDVGIGGVDAYHIVVNTLVENAVGAILA